MEPCRSVQVGTARAFRAGFPARAIRPVHPLHAPPQEFYQKLPRPDHVRHPTRDVYRPGDHDGNRLAPPGGRAGVHSAFHQRHLLRLGVHLLHGDRVRPRFPRGPRDARQRARQRPLRARELHDRKLPHRRALPM